MPKRIANVSILETLSPELQSVDIKRLTSEGEPATVSPALFML